MDRHLSFYDLTTGAHLGELCDDSRTHATPLCLAYVSGEQANHNEMIISGNDTGAIYVHRCSDKWMAYVGRQPVLDTKTFSTKAFSAKAKFMKHTYVV